MLKPQQMTLAYVQVLQYWVEEANLLAPGEAHSLAMGVRELRWHIRRYTTFTEHGVFEGIGKALSRAVVKDTQPSLTGTSLTDSTTSSTDVKDTPPSVMGILQADSTTSSTDIKDTQPSPTEIPSMNNTTISSVNPEARIEKDLPATQSASHASLEDPDAPHHHIGG